MSVNDIDIKKHAKKAATLLICAPVLKVPQAMHTRAKSERDASAEGPPHLEGKVESAERNHTGRTCRSDSLYSFALVGSYPRQHAYFVIGTVGHYSVGRGDPTS